MFTVTDELRAKMESRLTELPVNARHLLIASGISYDECFLGEGVTSSLQFFENRGFVFRVSNTLTEAEKNQANAHALAHLMLHSTKFENFSNHVDTIGQTKNPFPDTDPLSETDDAAANRLALEILIPAIPLREAFRYFEGRTMKIAKRFNQPPELVHLSLIRQGLMDERAAME